MSGSHTSDNAAADFSSRIRRLISTLEEASKQGGEQYAQRVRERQHGVGTVGSLAAYPGQQVERGIPRIPLGQLGEELRSAELAALNDSARIGSSPRKAEISQRSRLPSIDDANALKIESPSSSELSDDGWHGEGMVVTFKVGTRSWLVCREPGLLVFTTLKSLTKLKFDIDIEILETLRGKD